MSKENKNIDKLDDFSKLVKQKLENHQLPMSDDIWTGIEQKLNTPKPTKRRIVPWYWISGGIAAAIALLLLIYPIQNTSDTTHTMASKTEVSTIEEPKSMADAKEPASNSADADFSTNPKSTPTVQKNAAGLFPQKTKTRNLYTDAHLNTVDSRTVVRKEEIAELDDNSAPKMDDWKPKATVDTQNNTDRTSEQLTDNQGTNRKTEKIDRLPDLNDYPEIPNHPKRTRKKRPILLATTFGSSGTVTDGGIKQQDFAPMMSSTPPRQLVSKKVTESYSGILTPDDYSNAEHQLPLSVGVTVEKPLTERVSLESGLVYTYLKSMYRNPGSVDKNGTLQLHYLGVPLNVRVKAIKQPNWNLYTTAGTMVEKGLRSHYTQEVDSRSVVNNKVVKSSIEGVQWSVGGGVGFDYKLNKDLSLFLEPKLTYYLENNQPMSARTEQPLNIGVNGGLRIEL